MDRGDDTPLWLSHHWPHDFDRCIDVRGVKVCRRCAVLYPVALAGALVLGLVATWPQHLDAWLLWLLPLPAVIEFVGEHLGRLQPNPRRLVAATVPLGIACSRLYLRYLDDHTDPLVLAVVGVYGGGCLTLLLVAARRRSRRP